MVNASRCDVWVGCACLPVCIVACFIGFRGSVLLLEVHPYMTGFCTFWKVLFKLMNSH